MRRLRRAVDQIDAPGQLLRIQLPLQLLDGRFDARQRQSRGTEEAEETLARQFDHHARAGNAIGHGAAHIGKTGAMDLGKAAIAQPLGIERRQTAEELQTGHGGRGTGHGGWSSGQADADGTADGIADDVRGDPGLGQSGGDVGRRKGGRVRAGDPAEGRVRAQILGLG